MATMQSDVNKHLSGADVGVLIGYFIVVILVGILVTCALALFKFM